MAETVIEDIARPCPFCLHTLEGVEQLRNHIATHLLRIALFTLPRALDIDEESEADELSVKANALDLESQNLGSTEQQGGAGLPDSDETLEAQPANGEPADYDEPFAYVSTRSTSSGFLLNSDSLKSLSQEDLTDRVASHIDSIQPPSPPFPPGPPITESNPTASQTPTFASRGQPAARRVIPQDFFIESEGISREVLTVETPKYLGPEATCRPGVMNVRISQISPFRTILTRHIRDNQALSSRLRVRSHLFVKRVLWANLSLIIVYKDMLEDLRNLTAAFESENRTNQRQHYQGNSIQSYIL